MTSSLWLLLLTTSPTVAVLTSHGATGELRFQPLDATELAAPAATFSHGEGSPVLGTLLPGTRAVIATAVMAEVGDLSFSSALLRLEAGRVRSLADHVVYGSRPLVTAEGRVFVSRGAPGLLTDEGRVDALTIDEVHPETGALRTLYSSRGFVLFLVGAVGREVFLYELAPGVARLLAVHADTLGVRELVPQLPPRARDFWVDAKRGRVFFVHSEGEAWRVAELSLATRAWRDVAASRDVALLPAVLSDGALTFNDGPAPDGYERVVYVSPALTLAQHEVPGGFPTLWTRGPKARRLPVSGLRVDVAGVLP